MRDRWDPQIGGQLLEGLKKLQEKHTIIGDVRGQGLMLGVELVTDRNTRKPASAETAVVRRLIPSRAVRGLSPPVLSKAYHLLCYPMLISSCAIQGLSPPVLSRAYPLPCCPRLIPSCAIQGLSPPVLSRAHPLLCYPRLIPYCALPDVQECLPRMCLAQSHF